MKSRRRWRWRWQHRRFALGLMLYTLLLLLLVSYMLDYGTRRGRAGEEEPPPPPRHCPSLEEALGDWSWEEPLPPGEAASQGASGNRTGSGAAAAAAPGSRAGGKRHVYLHATWRTGSAFLGELFNQHPDVFYLYEPMWHLSNLSTASIFGWRTNKVICSAPLCPDAPWARAEVGLIDGAACERSCPPRALRDLEAECRKYPVVVIKDVRLLELGALLPLLRDPELDLRVVQLFRDPRAVHNSRLKAKQALLRESIQVLRSRHRAEPRALPRRQLLPAPVAAAALPGGGGVGLRAHQQHRAEFFLGGALEVICQAWLRDLLFSRRAPAWLRARYTQLRYEDLVLEPRAQLRRLLRFADLAAPPALESFVVNMTRGAAYSSERPFLISARDAREAIHAWRERLSREQVRQVEDACGEAMNLLAYPLSGADGDRLREGARGRPSAPPHPG
ncbi:PREDICTED: carbohydrate sulfotransferase 7 [Gekko japonicus]|uniref:Sulfotransferase n=1 Tax=Gekko japonicus TaxID=146911 RepID=A0ABM1JYA8_GEKJA|nr:PREDICTED: carbohydrate sulfotransferase 7 [Gekko japonicus]